MVNNFLSQVKSFALARVLMTAIDLDLFRHIQETSLSRQDLRERLGLAVSPITDAFFNILVAFEILSEEGERLALSPLGRSVLPAYESIKSWNKEMELFYTSLSDLPALLKSGQVQKSALASYWAYKKAHNRKSLDTDDVSDYSSVMDTSQEQLSQTILKTYDFASHDSVIDFGGGYGRLAISLAERYPRLRVVIADLPAVCERTRSYIDAVGLGKRVKCLPVDFFSDDLPNQAADVILFVRVLHDWNDNEVIQLLERTRPCLRPGGVALVVEPMTDDRAGVDNGSVLSSLMVTLLGGRRRSVQEYVQMLKSRGYGDLSWRDCGLSIYKMVLARLDKLPA